METAFCPSHSCQRQQPVLREGEQRRCGYCKRDLGPAPEVSTMVLGEAPSGFQTAMALKGPLEAGLESVVREMVFRLNEVENRMMAWMKDLERRMLEHPADLQRQVVALTERMTKAEASLNEHAVLLMPLRHRNPFKAPALRSAKKKPSKRAS